MPKALPPIVWILLAGVLLSFGAVSHASRFLANKAHSHAHSEMEAECPSNTKITIIVGQKKTCLVEHKPTYATQREYVRIMARKK
jgi:hypothetical protein